MIITTIFHSCLQPVLRPGRILRPCAAVLASLAVHAQTPPVVVSVSPPDGATQVPTQTKLVFTFDQPMDTTVVLLQSAPGLVGSFEVTAPGFNQVLVATWGPDQRTLTVEPAVPFPYATFSWTLNPPGVQSFFQIKSAEGTPLPTVSGTFSTGAGGQAPQLGSTVPAHGATDVRTNVQVEFRFTQAMTADPQIAGNPPAVPAAVAWSGEGVDPARFSYTWSADRRTLFADYLGGLPLNTTVGWRLNPVDAPVKLTSESGIVLEPDLYSGEFTTGNAEPPCLQTGWPADWGTYALTKRTDFRQESEADPVPDAGPAARVFSAVVTRPTGGMEITSASLTRPGGLVDDLAPLAGVAQYYETAETEAALDAAFPPGDYGLRFTPGQAAEQVIAMTIPAEAPPVPKIANYAEAQTINPKADFTLTWNGFPQVSPNDYISMYLSDAGGHVVFQAPNLCVPRELPATATSVVIPADTLRAEQTYTGALLFSRTFYFATNAVPSMAGFGSVIRNTSFSIQTRMAPPPAPATLTAGIQVPGGNPQLSLSGTPGRDYQIQRSADIGLPAWTEVGTVRTDAEGKAVFQEVQAGLVWPLFYRAVAPE